MEKVSARLSLECDEMILDVRADIEAGVEVPVRDVTTRNGLNAMLRNLCSWRFPSRREGGVVDARSERMQKFVLDTFLALGVGRVWDTFPLLRSLMFWDRMEIRRLKYELDVNIGGIISERKALLAEQNK